MVSVVVLVAERVVAKAEVTEVAETGAGWAVEREAERAVVVKAEVAKVAVARVGGWELAREEGTVAMVADWAVVGWVVAEMAAEEWGGATVEVAMAEAPAAAMAAAATAVETAVVVKAVAARAAVWGARVERGVVRVVATGAATEGAWKVVVKVAVARVDSDRSC